MSNWDPSGILEPNVEIDVVSPVYSFGGQNVQWGEMFAGLANIPQTAYPTHKITALKNGTPFDVLQWFIDTYGIENIPRTTTYFYFDDSGPTQTRSLFTIVIQWDNNRCFFGAGYDGIMNDALNLAGICNAQYSYGGCDLNNITEKDHQLARMFLYQHTDLSPDATGTSVTNPAYKTYMIYQLRDVDGNPPPLTGLNTVLPKFVEPYGYVPDERAEACYTGFPNAVNYAFYPYPPPAFMYRLIENYVEEDAQTGGGIGDYGFYSDSIGFSDLPTIGFVDTGFTRMFAPTLLDIQQLADFLWSDAFLDNIKVSKDNALNSIINLGLLPVKLAAVRGSGKAVKVGNVPTGITMPELTEQYLTVDMGEVSVRERWGTSLDYEPSVSIECYLPFVGFVQLPASEVVGPVSSGGGKVAIRYNINLFTGEFIAQIKTDNRGFENVLQQHTGTMLYSCPMSAANYSSFYKNILGGAVQAISQLATGNIAGAVESAAAVGVNSLAPTTVQRSGTVSGGSAIMGGFTPYLILRRPVQHLDAGGYGKTEGFPSYVYRQLSSVHGFAIIEAIEITGFTGFEEEAKELEQILKEGVYL